MNIHRSVTLQCRIYEFLRVFLDLGWTQVQQLARTLGNRKHWPSAWSLWTSAFFLAWWWLASSRTCIVKRHMRSTQPQRGLVISLSWNMLWTFWFINLEALSNLQVAFSNVLIYFMLIILWIQLTSITKTFIIFRNFFHNSDVFITSFLGCLPRESAFRIFQTHRRLAFLCIFDWFFDLSSHVDSLLGRFTPQAIDVERAVSMRSNIYDVDSFWFKHWHLALLFVMGGWSNWFRCLLRSLGALGRTYCIIRFRLHFGCLGRRVAQFRFDVVVILVVSFGILEVEVLSSMWYHMPVCPMRFMNCLLSKGFNFSFLHTCGNLLSWLRSGFWLI